MKLLSCERCGARVFFENVICEVCKAGLGFIPSELKMGSFEVDASGNLSRLIAAPLGSYRHCANQVSPVGCNWVVSTEDPDPMCVSCRTTRIIPMLNKGDNGASWSRIEAAKRRLTYGLLSLGLPLPNKAVDPQHGVAFEFLEETDPSKKVLTGHDEGVITLNIAEANDARREEFRARLHEPYRTLLGHFRHEIGHYYWDRLIWNTPWLDQYRQLFGDERTDYSEALKRHYEAPIPNWQERYISSYASSHPWEDWAECWAHYMHLWDGLETAAAWGLRLDSALTGMDPVEALAIAADETDLRSKIVLHWLPISQFSNAMSRSMGGQDTYPFVMPDSVIEKLSFIHQVIGAGVRGEVAIHFTTEQLRPEALVAPEPAAPLPSCAPIQ